MFGITFFRKTSRIYWRHLRENLMRNTYRYIHFRYGELPFVFMMDPCGASFQRFELRPITVIKKESHLADFFQEKFRQKAKNIVANVNILSCRMVTALIPLKNRRTARNLEPTDILLDGHGLPSV